MKLTGSLTFIEVCSPLVLTAFFSTVDFEVSCILSLIDTINNYLVIEFCMKEMLYEVRYLKSSEDMILTLAGQFKQLL